MRQALPADHARNGARQGLIKWVRMQSWVTFEAYFPPTLGGVWNVAFCQHDLQHNVRQND